MARDPGQISDGDSNERTADAPLTTSDLPEPTAAELAAIDDEMLLIEAGIDLVDAEISHYYAEDRGGPTALDWRRLRRAEARVTRVAAELADRGRIDLDCAA